MAFLFVFLCDYFRFYCCCNFAIVLLFVVLLAVLVTPCYAACLYCCYYCCRRCDNTSDNDVVIMIMLKVECSVTVNRENCKQKGCWLAFHKCLTSSLANITVFVVLKRNICVKYVNGYHISCADFTNHSLSL